MKQQFVSPTFGKLSLQSVIDQIVSFLKEDPESLYRLVIGSDSQERFIEGNKVANYVTAIVVHRKGKGGRYFWKNGKKEKIFSLRQKIYSETLLSLEVAGEALPLLQKKLNGSNNWELEIHIDVGRYGKTRSMIKEVVGMVTGNGFNAKTKPDAYAASSIADRHA